MTTTYKADVVAWANEQAALIRAKRFDLLDLENLAEEIEDVGKSEKRELASRMAVLLAHLLKWQHQPGLRGRSWSNTVKNQREAIELALQETPSLRGSLEDPFWIKKAWLDAVSQAQKETGLDDFPSSCPWTMTDVLAETWLPEN
jgi:Domain of unknown function DUF29